MSMRTGWITACIMGAWLAYGARVAEAALLIDLRETGTGFKEAWLTSGDLNKPISIDVFVRVNGASGNPAPEMFSILQGSFISPEGAIGEIAPAGYYDKLKKQQHAGMKYESYGFIAYGSSPGQPMDLDGDGDLDLGAPMGQVPVVFRSAEPVMFDAEEGWGRELPDGSIEFLVGRITYTPTALSWPHVTFVPRMSEPGVIDAKAALWIEDGQLRDGTTGTIVVFPFGYIPEPSSLCLLGLAGTTLLRRGRRQGLTPGAA